MEKLSPHKLRLQLPSFGIHKPQVQSVRLHIKLSAVGKEILQQRCPLYRYHILHGLIDHELQYQVASTLLSVDRKNLG